ncbi:MAG: hypothetical protein LC624_04310 [Halobacteriales archaeon]|nr:hypothetical protein [Halobacteriales archaeon]
MRGERGTRLAAFAGLLLLVLAGCTGPGSDADGDGLDGAQEVVARDILLETREGTVHRAVTSDPELADTDGDGVGDGAEAEQHTDPSDVDSDGDGLLDGHDLPAHTPLAAQLLARGIARAANGTFLGELELLTKPFSWDSDRPLPDGLSDGDEVRGWNVSTRRSAYHVGSDPLLPDTDRDGLSDLLEQQRGCDPRLGDSDGDGVRDALDADCAHDLRLVVSVPRLVLARDLDPQGGADLLVEANSSGLGQSFRAHLAKGGNNLTFRWDLDVPDQGPWHELGVPVVLTFWDEDLAGNDAQSGVQRQALRLSAACENAPLCNSIQLDVGLFTHRWTDGGTSGEGTAALRGDDGGVDIAFEPRFT